MNKVELTDKDYRDIKDMALTLWRDKNISYRAPEDFVCRCYVEALGAFCKVRGLTLRDGNFYYVKNDEQRDK